MHFPHFDYERQHSRDLARRAVESHTADPHSLDPKTRAMIENEHTGIELTGVEAAYLQNAISERINTLEETISRLGRMIHEQTAPNPINTEKELDEMKAELTFLKFNLGEKLFQKSAVDTGKSTH